MEGHYAVHIAKEKRGYEAVIPGHPAVRGSGPTREAAIRQAETTLREAVAI